MSDSHNPDTDTLFEPLQQIEGPASLRTSNRAALAQAFTRAEYHRGRPSSWWQRRISISLPVAAAILLFIGLQLILQIYTLKQPDRLPVPVARETPVVPVQGDEETESPRTQYQQESVYLAGLGTIYSAEFHHIEEM